MNKAEFIKIAPKMGYCSKQVAEEYCKDKDTLTDDDFIGVYRMQENQNYKNPGQPLMSGGRIRKRYLRDGGSEANR